MICNRFLVQHRIGRLLFLPICTCLLIIMLLWATASLIYAESDIPVNGIPTYFLAPFLDSTETSTDSSPSISLSRRSMVDANIQIIYRGFMPDSRISLSLYRIQGYSSIEIDLAIQQIQIGKAGKYRQPLTTLLGLDSEQIKPGQYLLLACYSTECTHVPRQEIGEMDWPQHFSTLIKIGMDQDTYLAGDHHESPTINIVQIGTNSSASYVTDGLVFQVETLDPAQDYILNSGIDSVELALLDVHGDVVRHNISAVAPYCLFGSKRGSCKIGTLPEPGVYTLQAIATTRDDRIGTVTKRIWIDEAADGIITTDPVEATQAFYAALDQGVKTSNLQNAYYLLSEQRRSSQTLIEFEADFSETYATLVERAEMVNQTKQQAVVHVVMMKVDKIDGELESTRYDIICRLVQESDTWRVDEIYSMQL